MNPRIQILLESRRLERQPADDAEVAAMWAKAVRTLRSSELDALDPDSRFTLTYQSALQGASAVLRGAGYRVMGGDHHHNTFAGVLALGLGAVSDAARDLDVLRVSRHQAIYDARGSVTESQLSALRSASARLLAEAHHWLQAERPQLDLAPPSPRPT